MDANTQTNQKDKPLTRADVERRLQEVGSSDKLDLSGQNLQEADLSYLNLAKVNLLMANLSNADLRGTDLRGTNLRSANLSSANLSSADLIMADLFAADLSEVDLTFSNLFGANLFGADLCEADLSNANLSSANLIMADLSSTDVSKANLSQANLSQADLRSAKLIGTNLSSANLTEAYLILADLSDADLTGADLTGAILPTSARSTSSGTRESITEPELTTDNGTILHLRITEEPLTVHNLSTILSALTELSTKCWLIAKGRFADLVEYTQTRNRQFDEESGLIISSITYNSPFNIKFTFSIEEIAKSVQIVIDAVIGAKERKKELELKNYDRQLDSRRKQIDLFDYASEKIPKIIKILNPNADTEINKIILNTLIKTTLRLEEGEGLNLPLLLPQENNKGGDATDDK